MSETAVDVPGNATDEIWANIEAGSRAILVDSPPGAGKSTLVREIARRYATRSQVPIIVQTNEQADDMVRGFIEEKESKDCDLLVGRLHRATGYLPPSDIATCPDVIFSNLIADLHHCHVIVATAAKWATIDRNYEWPFAIIDEAYQMRSDALIPIGSMMDRLLLVGDPGQLDPFTIADDTRFRGRALSPTETAATTILTTHPAIVRIPLTVSWRLPPHAAPIIANAFYQIPFTSGIDQGVRRLEVTGSTESQSRSLRAVNSAAENGWAYFELDEAIMPPFDGEAIEALGNIVGELLSKQILIHDENGSRSLLPEHIAVGVTHRDQRDYVRVELAKVLGELGLPGDSVTVDTANVLQGREFEIVLVWHPLSGRRDASAFHLDAGRLCVLLSRHRQACIVVSRAGIREQLRAHPSIDAVWLGEAAPVMDGWNAHLTILDHLEAHRV